MSDITRILSQIEQGDPQAAEKLLSLVYEELRTLAAAKLAQENPGQTLQSTALIRETYLRLVGDNIPGNPAVFRCVHQTTEFLSLISGLTYPYLFREWTVPPGR